MSALVALGGCADVGNREATAGDTATMLLTAVAGKDGADVYGQWAQVRLTDDTTFLAVFPGGWRAVAAGCEPRKSRHSRATFGIKVPTNHLDTDQPPQARDPARSRLCEFALARSTSG